jgi:membrane peptidoglycan carboxypeptidase
MPEREPLLDRSLVPAGPSEPGRRRGPLVSVGFLLVCALLAGLMVAAAAFPAVAVSGLVAKAGAETFDKLPAELTVPQAPQASQVLAADGKTTLAVFFDENRRDVRLADIAPAMRNAMIAAEDQKFYEHSGVDFQGFLRALVANSSGGSQQGASTLTMQLVRMAVTYSATDPNEVVAATEDTNARKVREMRMAAALERELTKDEILERYLNLAPFGHGTYGVAAASQFYFGKHPRDLAVNEAAMIAGLVKAPSDFDPLDTVGTGVQDTLDRRNWVLGQMVQTGAITAEQRAAEQAVELKVKGKAVGNGCATQGKNHWGFFCDYFYRWWLEQDAFGATEYDRERRLKSGGYRIVTTLDLATQEAAHRNVEQHLATGKRDALMVAAIQPGTGAVRALATNRTFALDNPANPKNKISSDPAKAADGVRGSYPRTTNPLLTGGGGVDGYQAGSTFKIFPIVAALEQGIPLSHSIDAKQRYESKYLADAGSPVACEGTTKYCPGNDNPSMAGRHDMWTAFGRSVNTYFIPLLEEVGAAKAIDVAERLGIRFRAAGEAAMADDPAQGDGWGSFPLGVSATTPLDLANAYATLAADGRHCEPTPVQQIREQDGTELEVAAPRCDQAVSPEVARAAIDAARCPVGDQSAFGRCQGATESSARDAVGHPVAGKTGTTDSHRTASLVVTTRSLSVAGILADPDWPATTTDMSHDIVNPAVYETLADAMKGKQQQDFPAPPESLATRLELSAPDSAQDPGQGPDQGPGQDQGGPGWTPGGSGGPGREPDPAGG